jgi:hypothetical protein
VSFLKGQIPYLEGELLSLGYSHSAETAEANRKIATLETKVETLEGVRTLLESETKSLHLLLLEAQNKQLHTTSRLLAFK